jgi:hypothetical protein
VARISTIEELLGLPKAIEVTEIVTIPDLGTVKIRALSRREHSLMADECQRGDAWDQDRWEILLIQHSLAEPELTYDQAAKLRETRSGPVIDLLNECSRFSGLTGRGQISKEAVDAAEATFRQESGQIQDVSAS